MSFHQSKVGAFPDFAGGVRDGVYGNPTVFGTVPILQADFQALLDGYNNARYAYEQGGKAQKGPYQESKERLMDALDALAQYVDGIAQGNENTILLAGYVPTKGYRSEVPSPVRPTNVSVSRDGRGVLKAECSAQPNTVSYGCILTANDPLPPNVVMNGNGQMTFTDQDGTNPDGGGAAEPFNTALVQGMMDFNTGRRKRFENLTPGVTYHFVFYASNATGVSKFSDSVSLMCG